MARKQARKAKRTVEILEPTPEQFQRSEYTLVSITERGQVTGAGFRKVRELERLFSDDVISPSEFAALHRYRLYADMADKSPLRDSLDRHMPQGGSSEIPPYILDAKFRAGAIERSLGSLCDMTRAIIVDDMSVVDWVIDKGYWYISRDNNSPRIRANPDRVKLTKLDLRMAARWVAAEFDA